MGTQVEAPALTVKNMDIIVGTVKMYANCISPKLKVRGFSLDGMVLVHTSTNQRAASCSTTRSQCMVSRVTCAKLTKMASEGLQNDDFPPVEDWDIRLPISF